MTPPDPFDEIRLLDLRSVPGANFWSRRPVTRADVHPGRFDEISSAEVPGFSARLVEAFPGLAEHRCSVGEPGGFLIRLRRGTYAPHIIEHVALAMQAAVGHDVGFGRTRGGGRHGEYTVVVEHIHPAAGRVALRGALDAVRRALAGAPVRPEGLVAAVRRAAGETLPPPRPPRTAVLVVVGGSRGMARHAARHGARHDVARVDFAELLRDGLSVRGAEAGLVLDLDASDLPPRYREADRVRTLASIMGDAVRAGGLVAVPRNEPALADALRAAGCRTVALGRGNAGDPDEVLRSARRLAETGAALAAIAGREVPT